MAEAPTIVRNNRPTIFDFRRGLRGSKFEVAKSRNENSEQLPQVPRSLNPSLFYSSLMMPRILKRAINRFSMSRYKASVAETYSSVP